MTQQLSLGFYGGVGSVTGANFLLKSATTACLVDCGMKQGPKVCDDFNYDAFEYDPSSVDALIVTHAHLDHIGRIPKLVRDGFQGVIYSTPETKKLAQIMLEDGVRIIAEEAKECGLEPLYTEEDVERAVRLWQTNPYHQPFSIGNFKVLFRDAGHILGSAMAEITDQETNRKIVFTGDLGNSPAPLLRDTEMIQEADYLIMESVYGDRNHEKNEDRLALLKSVIVDTIAKKGTLMIPAFSIERTQILLYEINNLVEHGEIPAIPVFLDSPLAIRVTDVYRQAPQEIFNEETRKHIDEGDDIFDFKGLMMTPTVDDSKAIRKVKGPKIVIAGSGMSHAGRIIHHEKQYLSDPKNTLLFVGYQAVGSLGRQIQEGAKKVRIFRDTIPVRARIETIHGYSGHRDMDGLLEFASHVSEKVKKVFVAMGEPKSSQFLAQRLKDYLDIDALYPELGSVIDLE